MMILMSLFQSTIRSELLEEIRTYVDMEKEGGDYYEYWRCLAHLCRHQLQAAEEVRACVQSCHCRSTCSVIPSDCAPR